MDSVKERAAQAIYLRDYEPFRAICAEIKADAVALFLNPASDTVTLSHAHERVRAVEVFMAAIGDRIDAAKIAEKRAQDRNGD